jgi:hypothetical protein
MRQPASAESRKKPVGSGTVNMVRASEAPTEALRVTWERGAEVRVGRARASTPRK